MKTRKANKSKRKATEKKGQERFNAWPVREKEIKNRIRLLKGDVTD